MDITSFINFFLDLMAACFVKFYNILSSIEFLGTSLFDYMIAVFILGIVIPLLFAIARSSGSFSGRMINKSKNGD